VSAVCKVEGCGRPEKASRGRYAHLCTVHIAELKSQAASNGAAELNGPVVVGDAVLLQNAADRVADAAFEVQAAKEKLGAAVAEARTIMSRIASQ
jgi:hypothetical protein